MKTYDFIVSAASVLSVFFSLESYARDNVGDPVVEKVSADSLVLSDTALLEIPEGYELADSLVFVPALRVDTTLVGKNIFYLMPSRSDGGASDVHIYQSSAIVDAMNRSFETNPSRAFTGYRVRIFFDNRQSARQDSEAMMASFEQMYPGIPAYRSYVNPYFKITVGDFRTKSEAMNFLRQIIGTFPKAFIVKENIEYPVLDKDFLGSVDTVKVLRKTEETITM